jgi:hypothetical protein
MIPLSRSRKPADIVPTFKGQKLIDNSLVLLSDERAVRQGTLEKHAFKSEIWKRAKKQLLIETHDKCAYCEAPTTVVAFGDVEHYRPKSVYWWLAYCVENYLASCAVCNQLFKSDTFNFDGPKMKAPSVTKTTTNAKLATLSATLVPDPFDATGVADFATANRKEKPRLINPYFDDPDAVFAWRADDVLKEVELIPAGNGAAAKRAAAEAVAVYGINRLELRRLRYFTYEAYDTCKQTLADPGISAATRALNAKVVQNMMGDERPFAGMIRYFERTT